MNPELNAKITAMIAERFAIAPELLLPEATMESLGIDSLAVIEFMFDVEDQFKIRLADSREPLKTLRDVFDEIAKAVALRDAQDGAQGGATA